MKSRSTKPTILSAACIKRVLYPPNFQSHIHYINSTSISTFPLKTITHKPSPHPHQPTQKYNSHMPPSPSRPLSPPSPSTQQSPSAARIIAREVALPRLFLVMACAISWGVESADTQSLDAGCSVTVYTDSNCSQKSYNGWVG
ncbi:hypothetical protein ABVK25_002898 [Lepraria finkii]|uniref:Uncharacterized protein n=1 Tax=Lepraria finkii TaxID=1340010 RepID=A0ABR4BF77_9LECA